MTPMNRRLCRSTTILATTLLLQAAPGIAQDVIEFETDDGEVILLDAITVQAAAEELKQAPGASVITSDDLQKRPVSNDISEIVRQMPGVNLTGNTTTGQRGNNRQIDIRGMGPENTLILIDGRPVLSRNSVRMGRSGERDTRGDSNWVPAEAIERIEVIRGPAAARYGSGASGGVVNIITKPAEKATTSVSVYGEAKDNDKEGASYRANIVSSGPIGDDWSYRTTLGYSKREADDADINEGASDDADANVAAGNEGVTNYDLSQLLKYQLDGVHTLGVELSYSRQTNEYAGDSLFRDVSSTEDYIGEESNIMQRATLALTHDGAYSYGDSHSYLQWEHTQNRRLNEGLAGSGEGVINALDYNTSRLDNVSAKTEWNLHSDLGGFAQTLTLGAEYRGEFMYDEASLQQGTSGVDIPGTTTDPADRDANQSATLLGAFAEDNILLTDTFTLTPGLRADWHSVAGFNLSPSLNASWEASPNVTFKAGLSRAFKAPNLYQTNPDYVYRTRGNGCPVNYPNIGNGCLIVGNEDLDHETSVNAELGINYQNDAGVNAGLTYFRNDYRNKIMASLDSPLVINGAQVFQWVNIPKALIEGFEANLRVPLSDAVTWTTNATVMTESINKSSGEPLSLVPDYTINTAFDFDLSDAWSLTVSATHYGETPSPKTSLTTGDLLDNPKPRAPYTLVNLSSSYAFAGDVLVTAGVKNLFNQQILREGTGNNAGANTYNEAGRTYSLMLTKTF